MVKRTPLRERVLPDYSTGEERLNFITHVVGAATGILILVVCVIASARQHDPWAVVGSAVYGFSLVALFTVSSVYHGLKPSMGKKVMQVVDHCTIYLLIAGTYTPVLLAAMRPVYPGVAWAGFGIEWGFALLAAALTAIDLKKYKKLSMICYLAMGWYIIFFLPQTIEVLTVEGFLWLLGGGLAYTIGAVFYKIGSSRRYFHGVFHIFVDIGALMQAICILRYVIPR